MSDASKKCPHDLAEAEAAVFADGLCPLCLKADLAAAREAAAREKIAKLENSLKIRDEHIENLEDQLDKGDN